MVKMDNLFKLLEERKITQKDLAEILGISPGNVGDWKTGRSKPGFDVLVRIAEYLDVSTDYLVGIIEKESPFLTLSIAKNFMKASSQKNV